MFTFFGVIHSASPDGNMYLPWTLADGLQRAIPYQFALAYAVLAAIVLLLSLSKESKEPSAGVDPQAWPSDGGQPLVSRFGKTETPAPGRGVHAEAREGCARTPSRNRS